MGNVGSRPDDGSAFYIKDQNRFSIAALSITNARQKVLLHLTPNSHPATQINVKRDQGDEAPIDFIQDPDVSSSSLPSFLLRLNNTDELNFNFTIIIRQNPHAISGPETPVGGHPDTIINGLTYVFASNSKDLDVLVTREFHADPNLHKNSNVQLVGAEYSTAGSPSIRLDWTWKWRPPKPATDRGGGWRNTCTFVEYDQRAHRLNTLATFSFWVHNTRNATQSPRALSPHFDLMAPARLRVPSSQSYLSSLSDSEGPADSKDLPSPVEGPEPILPLSQTTTLTKDVTLVDVNCQRPGTDISAQEDGPLFRATMKALEQKTGNMRARIKKVIKKAEAAQVAQAQSNEAVGGFLEALREASLTNAHAIRPALEHYFEKIARQIMLYEGQNPISLQKLIIDPLSKLYHIDIKQAESKKRDFEDESKEYYAYVSRYLGQRQDSLKEKKRIESDSKYQSKRRNFELKRFDYSSFMQDLHGGRKEQEVLSQLTKYADTQARSYLSTASKIEAMVPQLEALIHDVNEADKEFKFQRTEREEKRRVLEKTSKAYIEPESNGSQVSGAPHMANGTPAMEIELTRANSGSRAGLHTLSSPSTSSILTSPRPRESGSLAPSPSLRSLAGSPISSPGHDRFKGIRDLEDRNQNGLAASEKTGEHRKEGLLWALSRPGSHVDPRGLNKQAWHKFWIVLDQGKLSEYSNWKERLDLHMEPIDVRLASVREARNAERRFCFEVITPAFKRVYQATSEEDMNNWINAINNALQSAYEGRSQPVAFSPPPNETSLRRDIGSVLTGKASFGGASAYHHSNTTGGHGASGSSSVFRRTTVGSRPSYVRMESNGYNENPTKLLNEIRERDQGNTWCADCGSNVKTEWVSINLGIVLCIECSGIHRSLGTHVSKIRSLTLDTMSFTADIVEVIMQIGNRLSNHVWEAKLDPSVKPSPTASRDQRLKFITDKYVERLYIAPISPTLSQFATPDETLLASIKKNDINQVLYALALRANPKATDKSRHTPAVFLALAAADPATGPSAHPSATTTVTSTSASTTTSPATSPRNTVPIPSKNLAVFAVAELLLQNGADLPAAKPAFPLSSAALQYIEQRGTKISGDTLGALPSIRSPLSPGDKERERLLKRTSTGARFAGRT